MGRWREERENPKSLHHLPLPPSEPRFLGQMKHLPFFLSAPKCFFKKWARKLSLAVRGRRRGLTVGAIILPLHLSHSSETEHKRSHGRKKEEEAIWPIIFCGAN